MQSDMEAQVMLLRESTPAAELAARAVSSVMEGEVDPITAHINISRMEAAIKLFKENTDVRDIQFGDCRLEEAESGVKYDYSMCGDSRLNDMYKTLEALKADIKEREEMLKKLPSTGMADPDTGEVLFPPARSSKTTIKTTFKKQ